METRQAGVKTLFDHEPAFIGGFRSGSTLLVNLLGLHPEIAPWYETKCFCEALRWIRVLADPSTCEQEEGLVTPTTPGGFSLPAVYDRMRFHMQFTDDRIKGSAPGTKAPHEEYPLGPDLIAYDLDHATEKLEEWKQFISHYGPSKQVVEIATGHLIFDLGSMHLANSQGQFLVNKTPEIPRFGRELRACIGRCKFIHLIRDGREVALSATSLNWGTAEQIARIWQGMILQTREAAQIYPDDYIEIRYEDLVADPRNVVDRIFGFLDIRNSHDVVADYEKLTGKKISPATRKFRIGKGSRKSDDVLDIEAVAGTLLDELGYSDF